MPDFIPTAEIASAAEKGLRLYEDGRGGDGLVERTITDARRMAAREALSERKVRAMPGWFARHESDKRPGWDKAGEETPGYVAWLLWGGDTAAAWAERELQLLEEGRAIVHSEVRIITNEDLREQPALIDELREGGDFVERRVAPVTTEVRGEADGSWTLVGHAAVFDSQSENLGGFREVIQRGAFRKVLRQDGLDVRALFNHDQNQVLGRTTNGTLTLAEDPKGLRYEVNVADTSYGRDLRVLLERGDVSQSSFAFRVDKDGQSWTDAPDGTLIRTITNFTGLLDVSPVTYPAYAATSSMALTRNAEDHGETSSTSEQEQGTVGTAEQVSPPASSQPRRADEEGAHLHRARRLKLREKRVA